MSVDLRTPDVAGLDAILTILAAWQLDEVPVQLHSGDLAWNWRFGAAATAAAVRTWSRADEVLGVALVDSPGVVRLAVSPDAAEDGELADRVLADLSDRSGDLLPGDDAVVEARFGEALRWRLRDAGWADDEPWTPLVGDLADPVEDPGRRIEVVTPELVSTRTALQRAAFDRSTFTEERWHALASGPGYAGARCLVAFDDDGNAVAATTVWSAGPGRRGLIEPLGVHRDHRGRGHGRAMTLAAAAALRELGASSVSVATRRANTVAVATYASAGLVPHEAVPDFRRPPRWAAG